MFVDRLLNQGSEPLLEQWLKFTDSRAEVLGEDVVNASTPGYIQKDLSVGDFQKALSERLEASESAGPGETGFNVPAEPINPANLLFQDGNNRSMEQLMTDQAKNALMHNVAVELMRKQFAIMNMALTERPQ